MRVLVVGASGYLGTHVVRHARAAGMDVVTAGRAAQDHSMDQIVLDHVVMDLVVDPEHAAEVVAAVAPDAIVHCAGATGGSAEMMAEANISGVFGLLAAIADARFAGRLVHLGSAAEYGRTPVGSSVAETAEPRPVSVYGATKLGGTRLVELARRRGADAVVLRVFNPLGRGTPHTSLPGRLVAEVRRAVADGGPIRLGPLGAARDFVDVRDVAEAVVAAVTAASIPSPVLNVGSGRGVAARVLVSELLEISGCTSEVTEDSQGSSRSAEVPWQQGDVELAARELSWKPAHGLRETLEDWWRDPR